MRQVFLGFNLSARSNRRPLSIFCVAVQEMDSQVNPCMIDTEGFCYSLFHESADNKFNQSLWCSDYPFFFNLWMCRNNSLTN